MLVVSPCWREGEYSRASWLLELRPAASWLLELRPEASWLLVLHPWAPGGSMLLGKRSGRRRTHYQFPRRGASSPRVCRDLQLLCRGGPFLPVGLWGWEEVGVGHKGPPCRKSPLL